MDTVPFNCFDGSPHAVHKAEKLCIFEEIFSNETVATEELGKLRQMLLRV